ncbi:MAG: T9SS type A sorting domain-containing protein [Flavobacteriales bacterium]|nr:T9SS type A sorting domain-containing protein [Flavobacteriales bacterium]
MTRQYAFFPLFCALAFAGQLVAQSGSQPLKADPAKLKLQGFTTMQDAPVQVAEMGGGGPANDLCSNVTPLPLAVGGQLVFNGTTTGATNTNDFVPGSPLDGLDPTVWHAFTTTTCANVTISYCGTNPAFGLVWIFLSPTCPAGAGYVLNTSNNFTACGDNNGTLLYEALPAGTWYVPVLYDAAQANGAYTLNVSAAACAGGYCTAGATSTQFEKISNVTYANINNSSTSTAGYEDFTSITANVTQGATNSITVTIAGAFPEDQVLVWIDLNQNQIFEANELMYSSPMGVGPHSGPITIPMSATLGNTRMRVRLHDATLGPNATPCGTSTYGQVEDYTVNIQEAGGGGPPPNDLCTGAVVQNLAPGGTVTYSGDNTGANVLAGTNFVVVWEAFTLSTCANVTINYCVPGSEFTNFLINVVNQCPDVLAGVLTGTFTACDVFFAELPAGTYWIPVLVDPPSTPDGPYSISVSATACGAPPPGYCAAGATSTQFEKISNVTFAGFNNNSTSTAGYEDFTSIQGNVTAGSSNPISVSTSNGFPEDQIYVWIDWNQNEVFEANELAWTSIISAGPTFTGSIQVPITAPNGATRMRVRLTDTHDGSEYANVINAVPCGNSTYGQVEDYTIVVSGALECDADAGTLSGGAETCFEDGPVQLNATPNGDAEVPPGFEVIYVLTEGAGLVIIDGGPDPSFEVGAIGTYTIHTLVYDPNTLDLDIVEIGVTTGFDVNALLIQGGGTICASLDVAGAVFEVVLCCDADAGTLSGGGAICYEDAPVTLAATPNGDADVPAGFETIYVLTQGAGLVIIDASPTPSFEVDALGTYTIHTLVYDPNTLDLSIVEPGVTTGFDVNALLIQGGGTICASLDVAGAAFAVILCCDADAGTLNGGGVVCFEGSPVTLSATPNGDAVVPPGFLTVYALTQGAGLVIIDAAAAPSFEVSALGTYTIHTLVYDPTTLDLSIVELGVTTGFDVNALLIQGGGTICASLDVAGAAFSVEECGGYCDAGADGTGLGLEERIINVTFAGINNNSPNASPAPPAYSDFTNVTGTVSPGQTYPIAIDVARNGANTSYSTNQVLVWIDLNQDEDFFDAGELVFTSIIGSVDIYTGNVTIPAGTPLGTTRMRIRLHDTHDGSQYTNNFNDTPCGLASYGEVEDYSLIVQPGVGIAEDIAGAGWNVFPNPNTGDFTVVYGGADALVAMDVFDVAGRAVHQESRYMTRGEAVWMALGGKLVPGTYVLRFTTDNHRHEQRIVVH